ncbi:MAG: S16 family serine protease [Acidimicrobiia bacterium]
MPKSSEDTGSGDFSVAYSQNEEPERSTWWQQRWVIRTMGAAVVLVVLVVASQVVRVPYFAFSPGTMRPTVPLVAIDGATVYEPEGSFMLSTISISRQRLTLWGALVGWLDPEVTVMKEEVVLGDNDPDENRRLNLAMMDVSKELATYVALERLGYEVGFTGTGAVVASVSEHTPADGVLELGDTIVEVNGTPILVAADLVEAIAALSPGDEVDLLVEHFDPSATEARGAEGSGIDEHDANSQDRRVKRVTLGAREDDDTVAFLGVSLQTRDAHFVFPIDVDIETGSVGGPSAGLSFTLTILDLLTPGELTGGQQVAVTGTIDRDGTVGPIGGVEQKAATARHEGVAVFLVPDSLGEAELAAARRQAGDKVQIIEVGTLDEALAALESIGGDPLVVPTMAPDKAA